MFALVLHGLWVDEKWVVQPACCPRYICSFPYRAQKWVRFREQEGELASPKQLNLKKITFVYPP